MKFQNMNEIYSHNIKGIQVNYRLTSVDINGSHPAFQWFLGAFYSIVVFQSTGQGIESQKLQKLQKKLSYFGSHTRQSGIRRRFTVENDIFS
jgi:hypothetical protein